MFSRPTEYAIRAMTYLAGQPPGTLTGAKEISEAEDIPMAFLWKVLQAITRKKFVRSFKGIRGGYELAVPAGKIRLMDILAAMDEGSVVEGCLLGLPACDEDQPCPLHPIWKDIKKNMVRMLEQTTLADLAKVAKHQLETR